MFRGILSKKKDKSVAIKKENGVDHISFLPQEILLIIFLNFTKLSDLGNASCVSKLFLQIAESDLIWRRFFDEKMHAEFATPAHQKIKAKTFFIRNNPFLLVHFTHLIPFSKLLADTQAMVEMQTMHRVFYCLDELLEPKEKNKKFNQKEQLHLVQVYAKSIYLLNQIYIRLDVFHSDISLFLHKKILHEGLFIDSLYENLQKIVLTHGEKAMIVQQPKCLELILELIKQTELCEEYKFLVIIDIVSSKKMIFNPKLYDVLHKAIDWMKVANQSRTLAKMYDENKELTVLSFFLKMVEKEQSSKNRLHKK